MKRRWVRNEPGGRENGVALGVALGAAAGIGLVAFYLTRLFVSREEITPVEVGPARRGRPLGPRSVSGPQGERG